MLPPARYLPSFLASLALLWGCGTPPARSLHDWAAAHEPETWAPLSEGYLLHDPAIWAGGPVQSGWRIGQAPLRAIPEHAAFDQGILAALGGLDPADFAHSLEAAALACRTLLEEPAPAATKIAAAALLSRFAAAWRERFPGDLELVPESLASLAISKQVQVLVVAARSLRQGREATSPETLAAMGLHLALDALQQGSQSLAADVAEACRVRLEILQRNRPPSDAR